MIRFALKCDQNHGFESWFQSSKAFDKVKSAGMVSCPQCGSTLVEKTLMAPRVQTARKTAAEPLPSNAAPNPDATRPSIPSTTDKADAKDLESKIAALKEHVEATSDYVGENFAKEARAMHDGELPERAIYGEANIQEAKSLIEDGVPLAPLPFIPARKTN